MISKATALFVGIAVLALAAGSDAQVATANETANSAGLRLNPEGVLALLDVMDAVASLHPDFQEELELCGQMSDDKKEAMLAEVRERNEQDEALQSAVKTMLNTKTYEVYFQRFRNVTPEVMRDLLFDLPCRGRASPGGIGEMLQELLPNRGAVRDGLSRLLTGVDMDWVYETAQRWAPEADREPPTIYLIYDSNAGSFTAQGIPFFNVYTDFRLETLSSDDSESTLLEAQGTMAHELQHVFARPYLYPPTRSDRTWQQVWVDRITRGLVSEGVAIHCYPPKGMKKQVYEDKSVLSALVSRFNEVLEALSRGEMTEEEMRDWSSANYFTVAEDLLRQHLEKRYSGDELKVNLQEYMPLRPDLEHALGWWMVSRISLNGEKPDAAISLLLDPYSLYERYNDACLEGCEGLEVSSEALKYLQSVHEADKSSGGDK